MHCSLQTSGNCVEDDDKFSNDVIASLLSRVNELSRHHQSVCNWSYTASHNDSRRPSTIPVAECSSTTADVHCEAILYPVPVRILQEPNGLWINHVELVPVGCTATREVPNPNLNLIPQTPENDSTD